MPTRSRRALAFTAVAALASVLMSCDRKGPISPPPTPPQGPPPPVLVGLALVAPAEVAPGDSVQLTANATKSDGSVENVSSRASWTVSAAMVRPPPTPVLQISPTGLATGRTHGQVSVSVNFNGVSAKARILVLPAGTFVLSGMVSEVFGLENATVTVVSGVGEGVAAVTTANGEFELYGVKGPVQIRATKEGYLDSVQQFNVTGPSQISLRMVANSPRCDCRGIYTLTITAASGCSSIPDAARRRVYTATISQDDSQLRVSLSGSDFIVQNGAGNRFYGSVTPTGEAIFVISDQYGYYPEYDIAERFGDGALLVWGFVRARATPELISGLMVGQIIISAAPTNPLTPPGFHCWTDRFEMVRR